MTYTQEDFERDAMWLAEILPDHPQDQDSDVCPTCCYNRIITAYRDLVAERDKWEGDWADEYERNITLLRDLSPEQRLDYDNWKLWRDKALTLEAENERLLQEARMHAQEARTQRSTVNEVMQVCSGATGEKGDWNGAEPVRELAADRDHWKARAEAAERKLELVYSYDSNLVDTLERKATR